MNRGTLHGESHIYFTCAYLPSDELHVLYYVYSVVEQCRHYLEGVSLRYARSASCIISNHQKYHCISLPEDEKSTPEFYTGTEHPP